MSTAFSELPPDEPPEVHGPLIGPSTEQWAAMSPEQKERFLIAVNQAHSDPAKAMTEGQPHKRAVNEAHDKLSLHFSSKGRRIYLAEELTVVYPGEETFEPDLLAVLDVDQPEDDERLSWVVADEGKGPDLVLEVLYLGDRNKDLVRNVEWFARLGITEYFVFDRKRLELHGFRLPSRRARRYCELGPRLGRMTSEVLGLDLAVVGKRLRFFSGHAELVGSPELIDRLSGMMDDMEARAEARIAEERERAEKEREQAEKEHEQAGKERERATAAEQALLGALRRSIMLLLEARGLELPEDVRGRIEACDDAQTLDRWLTRAATVSDARELGSSEA